jgi:threonine synthase
VINEYADRLPDYITNTVVTLQEGGTPLVEAPAISKIVNGDVYIKYEGLNPTGSFKDRGMTAAISAAVGRGARAVICASTGNTSAAAAAFATRADLTCAVLVPEGKVAMGKLAQAVAHGARILQVTGNFDDCLEIARALSMQYPVELVNSVNPARIEGQKTAAFEIVDVLGEAPDIHCLPVGNAGNLTAYWKGYNEYSDPSFGETKSTKLPKMWGFQAAGSAPLVVGQVVKDPHTIATAIRIGNPASWNFAEEARDSSGGVIEAVTDSEILAAHRLLSAEVGIFVEPASAAGVAGLLKRHSAGLVPVGSTIAVTVTGHGLKDPIWAVRGLDGVEATPKSVGLDIEQIAGELGLQ